MKSIISLRAPQQAAAPSRVARASRRSLPLTLIFITALAALLCFLPSTSAVAQDAPYYSPEQLDHMVSRIALYPDPLLAQVLAAATYPDQIPDAARWADQHHYMSGPQLADAINYDQLPWDPSVQALLPFPSVLDMMASDMRWTEDLGNAFLGNQTEVMYAVQRMRQRARDYGYLRSNPQYIVASGPYITIVPARPDYIVVPYYDPVVVYERPRPGFFVGAAIGYRYNVFVGVAFRPWGWGYNRIGWNERVVIINNRPWHRNWENRTVYVHPYTVRRVVVVDHDHDRDWRDHERHEVYERSERERESARWGHERVEEHREVRHDERREVRHEERHDDRGKSAEHHDNGRGKGDHDDHGKGHGDHDDHGR